MIRKGRTYFTLPDEPAFTVGSVLHLRSSRRDPGFGVTVADISPHKGMWRVVVRMGDCTEHYRFLAWSGASSGRDARGYTETWELSMRDEPEAVSDQWLTRFREAA
jgi:hypothetical protein